MGNLRSSISRNNSSVKYIGISDIDSGKAHQLGEKINADIISANNSDIINDVLITTSGDEYIFESKKIVSKNTHGTGCSLASAIATNIGLGIDLKESIKISIKYVQNGIKNAPDFGSGNGPIRHF